MEGIVPDMGSNEFNMLQRVIVCGATGFIGSWLVGELLARGIQVTAIVRNKSNMASEYMENHKLHIIESAFDELSGLDIENTDCFYYLAWAGVSGKE